MVERGARNLILLSRSASSQNPGLESLIGELRSTGTKVLLADCDVADRPQLAKSLKDCGIQMPPIKGVIQAAMVLRVSVIQEQAKVCC
jgi:KR domain-containing protein